MACSLRTADLIGVCEGSVEGLKAYPFQLGPEIFLLNDSIQCSFFLMWLHSRELAALQKKMVKNC